MYVHNGGFIPLVPSQNHIHYYFEIYHFRRVVMQGYVPTLHSFFSTVPGLHFVRVDFCPPLTNSVIVSEGRNSEVISANLSPVSISWGPSLSAESISHSPCHNTSLSLAAGRDSDTDGFLPSGDVSSYYLVRMTQTWHDFLCTIIPRNPDFVNAGKHEVHHFDDGRV